MTVHDGPRREHIDGERQVADFGERHVQAADVLFDAGEQDEDSRETLLWRTPASTRF
jgi:hypothetical protein